MEIMYAVQMKAVAPGRCVNTVGKYTALTSTLNYFHMIVPATGKLREYKAHSVFDKIMSFIDTGKTVK